MTDLFLDPKILNYQGDRYETILLTLRWARHQKAQGSAEPMNVLIEKARCDLVEGKVTKSEVLAKPDAPLPPSPSLVVPSPGEIDGYALMAEGEGDKEKKGKTKKKKK